MGSLAADNYLSDVRSKVKRAHKEASCTQFKPKRPRMDGTLDNLKDQMHLSLA